MSGVTWLRQNFTELKSLNFIPFFLWTADDPCFFSCYNKCFKSLMPDTVQQVLPHETHIKQRCDFFSLLTLIQRTWLMKQDFPQCNFQYFASPSYILRCNKILDLNHAKVLHGSQQHLVKYPQRLQLVTVARLDRIPMENILCKPKNFFPLYTMKQKSLPSWV
jgi:hypothetical protein